MMRQSIAMRLAPVRLAATFCLALLLAMPAAAAVKIQEVASKSGVTAWLVEDYTVPIITVSMSFEGGAAQDPAGKEGLADLLSAMFDEGAGPYGSAAFQAKVEQLGISLGFSEGRDSFTGELRTIRDDRAESFELLRLSLNELTFPQDSLERMREQLKSRISRAANDPQTEAGEALRNSLFGDHPYGRNSRGTIDSLDAITRDDLANQFRKLFARDNLTVAVVGAISAEETAAMLDKVFSGLPEKAELVPVPQAQVNFGERIEVESAAPQTSLLLAYPGVLRSSPDFMAAYLVTEILGGGTFSSRLYAEVREKRGLAYSAGAGLTTFDRAAYVSVSAATRADRANETLAIMRAEIERLAKDGPTPEELERVKQYVIGSYAINFLDTSAKIARALVTIQTENLGIDYIERRDSLIKAVTIEDAKAAASRLLGAEPTVAIVGPRNS